MRDDDSETVQTKWNRSQRFQLSPAGHEAGANYREVIVASRTESGRKSFDAARAEWAARLALDGSDGLYFGELQTGPKTIEEMTVSLDGWAAAQRRAQGGRATGEATNGGADRPAAAAASSAAAVGSPRARPRAAVCDTPRRTRV